MFEKINLEEFWDDDEYALEAYVSLDVTDEMIQEVEQELGYKLPASYIYLMKKHNGGIPKNQYCPCDTPTTWADDHVGITGIYGIGREKTYSLCGEHGSKFWIEEWEYPDIGVAICDCPSAGHDMIFLDYRECGRDGEPKVVHIDQEWDYAITVLADNFEEFIEKLCSQVDLAKIAAAKILKEFGIENNEDFYSQDEEDGAVLYENLKAGVLEEYDITEEDMEDILEEILG